MRIHYPKHRPDEIETHTCIFNYYRYSQTLFLILIFCFSSLTSDNIPPPPPPSVIIERKHMKINVAPPVVVEKPNVLFKAKK